MIVFFSMKESLHAIVIHALLSFRKNNLYRDILQDNMLRTFFYADFNAKYIARFDVKKSNLKKKRRNALLIRILFFVESSMTISLLSIIDTEFKSETIRTIAYVHHLHIRYAIEEDRNNKNYVVISESFS